MQMALSAVAAQAVAWIYNGTAFPPVVDDALRVDIVLGVLPFRH